jgi:hypothetical protein
MYSKTAKSAHFLPRKGSYSTHPHRNGRVDVLPPGATDQLYDCASQIVDATAQLDRLRITRDDISQRAHAATRFDALRRRLCTEAVAPSTVRDGIDRQLRQVEEEMAALRRHIGSLKHLLAGGGVKTFDEAFARVAKAELSASVYESVAAKAQLVLAAANGNSGKRQS